jgi:transposase
MLNRTFGCVRVVWNRTLAARRARWHLEGEATSYAESDRALTAMKKDPGLAFLSEVSSVPLQQTLRRQLAYKCQRYGRRLVVVDRWYPSSRACSGCGHRLAELSLSARRWTCPACGARHDRDVNAATNILAAGRAVARGSPGDACGADVRHSGSSRVQLAAKQEPRPARAGIPVLQGGE